MKKMLFVIGLILCIGSPGPCDMGKISFYQAINQSIVGLGLLYLSTK